MPHSPDKSIVETAVDLLSLFKPDYGEARLVLRESETLSVKNGQVESISNQFDLGIGVRVLLGGSWGFACTNQLNKKSLERMASSARKIAEANRQTNPVKLAPASPTQGFYSTPIKINPFKVPLEEKINILLLANQLMRQNKAVKLSQATLKFRRQHQFFLSIEGIFFEQETFLSGGGIAATAIEDGQLQQRSYPNSHGGNYLAAGFEYINELALPEHAERISEEAAALLKAPDCPEKETTVVIDSSQMALQVHESIGHPLELDRILGTEISLAGGSFVELPMLRKFQYAAPIVSVEADATLPRGLGSFGFDDEGTPAGHFDLIKNGQLIKVLSSRETASVLRQKSKGCARADSWNRLPLVRMTNVNLKPGQSSLEEIISEVKEGLFFSTNKSWSIDDQRLNFQFALEWAQEIKNGKLGRVYKNANYTGLTPQFWRSCDSVGDKSTWQLWGFLNCGKGVPIQIMEVGHGAPVARFKNVKVGTGR